MFISRIFPEAPREQVFSRTPQYSTQILFGLTVFKPFISSSFYTGTVIKNFRDLSKILAVMGFHKKVTDGIFLKKFLNLKVYQ